jgi:hypothetical protein
MLARVVGHRGGAGLGDLVEPVMAVDDSAGDKAVPAFPK